MPSPIAHSATGYAIFCLISKFKKFSHTANWRQGNLAVLIANFADFDFIPQLISSQQFHRGPTHSICVASIFSLVLFLLLGLFERNLPRLHRFLGKFDFLSIMAIYTSHLLLDLGTTGETGVMLFWPFSETFYHLPVSIFPPVHHSRGLFYSGHINFIFFEVIYSFFLFYGLCWLMQNFIRVRKVIFQSKT